MTMFNKLKHKLEALTQRRRTQREREAEPSSNVHVMLQVWTQKAQYQTRRSRTHRVRYR